MEDRKPTVALVLGSGGARGYTHVGVIEVLLERGFNIIAIAGCSMGALVGGIYAAGKLKQFKDWATGLGQFDVLRLLDISLSSSGAIRGEKVFSVVKELIGDIQIEDLPIAYTAVATDLVHHKEVWFQEGSLHQAIRASVAIPSLFTPVVSGDRILADGGLLNPLPIMPTIAAHADYIVAVNLSFYDEQSQRHQFRDVRLRASIGDGWVSGLKQRAAQLFDRDVRANWLRQNAPPTAIEPGANIEDEKPLDPAAAIDDLELRISAVAPPIHFKETLTKGSMAAVASANDINDIEPEPAQDRPLSRRDEQTDELRQLVLGKFDMMNLAFETMQSALTQYKLAGYAPDILINVPKSFCRTFDYHKAPELIQLGRKLATEVLDRAIADGRLKN
jgi:NTE family protein